MPIIPSRFFVIIIVVFRPCVYFIIILPFGRARGGKTIWRVISERPHGTGRWPFSLLSHGLSRNRADVLVPKEMRAATAAVCLWYRCASLVCVCVSLARAVSFPVLFFVQSIGARKTFNARWQSASALTGLFRALTGEEGGLPFLPIPLLPPRTPVLFACTMGRGRSSSACRRCQEQGPQ